ncbi:MAG: family protein phosphatase, partial [Pseudonocardiales bacterium]|nr:family protein phosphatase [Pseudonocardiales bacterium]
MALYVRYAVRSDLGLVRGNNEDSVYAGPRLLAIADGMGGHAAGEVASKIAIGSLQDLDEDRSIDDLMAALREAVAVGNEQIAGAGARSPELEGMGTTLTALRFTARQVGLVHVGDSRAYLLRGDQLSQITHDDTYVQFLVDSGKLTPDEAKDHPRKSVILRALTGADVEPDVSIREARAGDRYLLCTDGLTDVVSAETIGETLRISDVQECADRLVELALRGGGPDNVTVIVADVLNARVGDLIDDVPVIAGAFVDPGAADVPGAGSPAERAARMIRPATEGASPTEPVRPRRWGLRTAIVVVGALALIAAGLGATYAWAQTQYFVGRDGSLVAIFRGVNAEFGPLKFFRVYKNTDLAVDDLYPTYRSQVKSGITARNANDAQAIITSLAQQVMPRCANLGTPSSSPTGPSGSPSTPGGTGAAATGGTPKVAPGSTGPAIKRAPTPSPAVRLTPPVGGLSAR